MTLPFFYKTSVKKKKEAIQENYPTLTSLIQKTPPPEEQLEAEDIDENFFYKHITTHFHSLFLESTVVCIPHTRSIQGLVITKDVIESHCFQPSPYFCDQYMGTRQKQKIITLDFPIITTLQALNGFKEERTVHIMAEENVYLKNKKKIRILSIDRLLEGEPPKYHYKPAITIPPIRNSRTDLEFLNMFPENLEALYELQTAVQEFTGSYVYIKGYNRCTVEKIQHMYMKTYRTILQRNKLLQDSCRTPSEHDQFLELVENVVMGYLHQKIWVQSLQSLLLSQDNYLESICFTYSNANLAQYSLRYPISEMTVSHFDQVISHFKKINGETALDAFTPLEKLAVLKSTLDLISSTVSDYIKQSGNDYSDASVTSDEMIPLLAFIIVKSHIPRIASLVYYMQHYRLARMIEGSVYSFVVTTMKTACEFLKGDPLSLHDAASNISITSTNSSLSPQSFRTRSTSFGSTHSSTTTTNKTKPNSAPTMRYSLQHRKSQSADLYGMADFKTEEEEETRRNSSSVLRPHIVLSPHKENRKSLDITHDWLLHKTQQRTLGLSRPMVSTTFPSISNSTPLPVDPTRLLLGRSLSTCTVKPPKVITIEEDHQRRPASICIDTRSLSSIDDHEEEELMGDFLRGLSKMDGDIVGGRSGSFRTYRRV